MFRRNFRLSYTLVIFTLMYLLPARYAIAQVANFYYLGPKYDLSECDAYFGSSPACLASGSLSGSVTVWGVTDAFSGRITTSTGLLAYNLDATGVGSVETGDPGSVDLSFINGTLVTWSVSGYKSSGWPNLYTSNSPGGYDQALNWASGSLTAIGFVIAQPDLGVIGSWSNTKSLGISCASQAPSDSPPPPGGVGCGNPINIGNGNKYEVVRDYSTVGQNPLSFIRYYNSMSVPDTYAVTLGSNWRDNFDRYLHIINPSAIYGVIAERADGQYISFSSSSGTYTTDTDLDYTLTKSGSTWTLTDPDDTVETYSQSGDKATLSSIQRRNGYTQTLNYSSAGLLASVSDSYSRSLGLSYSSAGLLDSVTTPDSLTLSYGYVAYSSAQRLTTVSYNTSPVTSQTYLYEDTSYPFALTGITDENNKRYATWAYDDTGRAVLSELAGGINFTSVTYDDATGNRLVKGPLGIVETYKFTNLQGVPKVTEIDRAANGTVAFASRGFTYDSNGYLATATDWNGNLTAYTNNGHGDPTQIIYASGADVTHTTDITYDTTWARLAHVITEPGLTATLNYDSAGNLATRVLADTTSTSVPYSTNGQSRTWTYTYTSTGLLTSAQLPRTDVTAETTFGYTGGTLTSVTDALGHVTTVNTFQPGGLPTEITDPNGAQTYLTYNPRNWLTTSVLTTTSPALTTVISYDSAGNLTKYRLPDLSYQIYAYDDAHRLSSIRNNLNDKIAFTRNAAGNVTQTLWKDSGGTTKRQHTATFDALGRMLTDVGGMSQTTTYGYDSNGNVTSITDPLSHVTTRTFDALNRLATSTNAVQDLVQFAYDAHDRPLTVTDGKGNATTFVYDGFGDTIQQTSPDSGATVWYYDPDANVTGRVQAGINFSSATYDALDRPLTATYPSDSSLNVAYTYDQTGTHGSGIGHLTSLTDAVGSLDLTWNQRGQLTSNARTIASTAYTTGYTYESAGRLASITYPGSSWAVNYARDAAGQVSGITATQPSHSPVNVATSIAHLPYGPVSGFTYGNGVTDTRTYDLDYRATSVRDTGTSGDIFYLSYGYDAANNPTSITDNVTATNSQALQYDAIDRLKYASSGTYGTVGSITFDSNSNRKTYGGLNFTVPATSDRTSQVGSAAVTYDSAGNITGVGTNTMAYNQANQLATITRSVAWNYGTDAFGRRLTMAGGTVSGTYAYGQSGAIIFESRTGKPELNYVWLDPGAGGAESFTPVAAITPGTTAVNALHFDRLGTPQKATNPSQTLVYNLNMNPNGAGTPSVGTLSMNLRWPGQFNDNTGMYNNGYRTYLDFTFPTYLQPDPIGLAGGLNPYIYAKMNPFRNIDPWGLDTQLSVGLNGTIGVLVVGAGAGASLGISIPDDPTNFGSYQVYGSGQVNAMYGIGLYVGWGGSLSFSHSIGPLNPGLNGEADYYGEGDIGLGPALGLSTQGSLVPTTRAQTCTVDNPRGIDWPAAPNSGSIGLPISIAPGEGVGVWLGGGLAIVGSTISKPIGSYFLNTSGNRP